MILLKIQMFSYTELGAQLGWADREIQLCFCCLRFSLLFYSFFSPKFRNDMFLKLIMYLFHVFIQEESYVEFLRIRRVPLQQRKRNDNVLDVVPLVRMVKMIALAARIWLTFFSPV